MVKINMDPESILKFKKMYSDPNITVGEISKEFGHEKHWATAVAKELNLEIIKRNHPNRHRMKPIGTKLEEFIKDYEYGMSVKDMGDKYDANDGTIRNWAMEEGAKRRLHVPFFKEGSNDNPSYDSLLKLMVDMSSEMKNLSSVGRNVSKTINTDRPIGLMFWADWHIGEPGTDYECLSEDIDIVRTIPNLYTYIGGNMLTWFSKVFGSPASGGINQFPPDLQIKFFEKCVQRIGMEKIVAMGVGAGCHEDWNRVATGYDIMGDIAKRCGVIYTQQGGMLQLTVGEQLYKIFRVHRSRFNSSFNLTHTVKRLWEFAPEDFDIGVSEHKHESTFEPFTRHGNEKLAIRTGTYNVGDDFARKFSIFGMRPEHPCVVLYPNKKRMIGFPNISDCVQFLNKC